MYNEYFGLKESPFSIAPDPRYLYMSEQHREALAHLVYGFNSDGGFVLLTGEVGTGKTTVCRCLLNQIPENTSIAFILNPKLTVEELLATICDEFRIKYPEGNSSVKVFIDLINTYLLEAHAKGRKAILVIDEAQNLSADVLEQLRLLTNLETNRCKLLQIMLLGQPELKEKLDSEDWTVLDVRSLEEYESGHIEGSINIYTGLLARNLDKIPKDKPIAVICKSGTRSGFGCSILKKHGVDNIYNIMGGMTSWSNAGYPKVK